VFSVVKTSAFPLVRRRFWFLPKRLRVLRFSLPLLLSWLPFSSQAVRFSSCPVRSSRGHFRSSRGHFRSSPHHFGSSQNGFGSFQNHFRRSSTGEIWTPNGRFTLLARVSGSLRFYFVCRPGNVSSAMPDLSSSPRPSLTMRSYCAFVAAASGKSRPAFSPSASAMPLSFAACAAEKKQA